MLKACKTETSLSKRFHGSPEQFPLQKSSSLKQCRHLVFVSQWFSKCGSQTSSISTEWKHLEMHVPGPSLN